MQIIVLAAATALIALTGCGGGDDETSQAQPTRSTPATTTSAPPPGSAAFLAEIKKAGLGTNNAFDQEWLGYGNRVICAAFGSGSTYGQVTQVVLDSDFGPSEQQADVMVRSAVRNLCPEHAALLP